MSGCRQKPKWPMRLCPTGGAHPEAGGTEKFAVCTAASRQTHLLALGEHCPYNMNTSIF